MYTVLKSLYCFSKCILRLHGLNEMIFFGCIKMNQCLTLSDYLPRQICYVKHTASLVNCESLSDFKLNFKAREISEVNYNFELSSIYFVI